MTCLTYIHGLLILLDICKIIGFLNFNNILVSTCIMYWCDSKINVVKLHVGLVTLDLGE